MKKLILYAALLLLPPQACAGSISLRMEPVTKFANGKAGVKVTVSNKGDEAARNLAIEASVADSQVRTQVYEKLPPGGKLDAELDLGRPPRPAGTYTVVLKAVYSDRNGHRFSALQLFPLITAEPGRSLGGDLISIDLEPASVAETATSDVSLSASSDFSGKLRMVFPDEFECTPASIKLDMSAGSTTNMVLKISNRTALAGSRYPVYAVAEGVIDRRHVSVRAHQVISVVPPPASFTFFQWLAVAGALAILAVFTAFQFLPPGSFLSQTPAVLRRALKTAEKFCPAVVLAGIFFFMLSDLSPGLLILDTTATGGDTPAHNYLAGLLSRTLLDDFQLVSWSQDWWCGFPAFQFYFVLPYLATALLDLVLPFNVAFKLVTVAGILALPLCVYASCRIASLPRITGIAAAAAMVPVLYDHTHTMWGLNIYSTLAGMISNSWSFCIMVLFVAMAYRDAGKGRFRASTGVVYALLISSHFFTSIAGTIAAVAIPFCFAGRGFRKALAVVAGEGLLGAGLMAWWIVPLVAKREFAVDFGTNWEIVLTDHLPPGPLLWLLAALALTGVALGACMKLRYTWVVLWMLVSSLALFFFGFEYLSPVFVNVRLWPFVVFSFAFLCAMGLSLPLSRLKLPGLAGIAVLLVVLAFGIDRPNHVPDWSQWNYEGMEKKDRWDVFEELVLPLDGTPGRLANDLHEENNVLGSTRAFEAVPHLIDKPVLEGGIVNSALGSLFSYYIQGETSKNTAGYPPIVRPADFNFTNATRHLELFNVKHFIARWSGTKAALEGMAEWKKLKTVSDWSLYELTSHRGNYVYIPKRRPVALEVDRGMEKPAKKAALEWMYNIELIDQPFAILGDDRDRSPFTRSISQKQFYSALETNLCGLTTMGSTVSAPPAAITNEKLTSEAISFTTSATGLPHIVKCTYFPNWQVEGAETVYMVSPGFMLVYPEKPEVRIYYGNTRADNLGRFIALLAAFGGVIMSVRLNHRPSKAAE